MGSTQAHVEVEGSLTAAETLWYDVRRWPSFIDGFAHVARQDDDWPRAGSTLVWDSGPHGRGRVVERVTSYMPGEGQTSEVEDPRLRGEQSISFHALDDGLGVRLVLHYELKQGGVMAPVIDLFFVRRAIRDSLRRTLERFAVEVEAEAELGDRLR